MPKQCKNKEELREWVLSPENWEVDSSPEYVATDCWISSFYKRKGIPSVGFGGSGKKVSVSRVVAYVPDGWEGLQADHHCDTPACVRPEHVYIGNAKSNAEDREKRKRHPHSGSPRDKNESHYNASLNNEKVRFIRKYNKSERQSKGNIEGDCPLYTRTFLANMFGVSRTQINRIINNQNWDIPNTHVLSVSSIHGG